MRYQILSFRYYDSMSFVCYKNTYEEAVAEIDRLAKTEEKKREGVLGWLQGDKVKFTFIPVGS